MGTLIILFLTLLAVANGGLLTYLALARASWRVRLAIGAVVALNPGLVFMATSSVMSECAFALAQMAALIAVERCARSEDKGKFWLFALLAAAACSGRG